MYKIYSKDDVKKRILRLIKKKEKQNFYFIL